MRTNKPPSEAVLARASDLRAGGSSWVVVAEALHRSPETVRKWPRMYPELWHAALHAAERRLAAEAGGESLLILRQLLRSKDDRIRGHAARSLIQLHLDLARLDLKAAAQKSSPDTASMTKGQLLVALLEDHTDEQLEEMAAGAYGQPARDHPQHSRDVDGSTE